MKLATFRMPDQRLDEPGATFAAAITETDTDDSGVEYATQAVMLEGIVDVGTYLTLPLNDRQERVHRAIEDAQHDPSKVLDVSEFTYDTLISYPSKVFCIGLNYRNHILETGLKLPEYPTVFAKYGQTLTGPYSDIELPALDHRLDYEGELAVIISAPGKNIPASNARNYIAGYAVSNDFSLRGMQGRTDEWTQGKIFEATTPVGPWLVTPDEFKENARLTTLVNGEIRQDDSVDDLVFKVDELVEYLSQIITLLPGDIILTGTPGGVALAMRDENGRRPWLKAGDVVETRIEGLGAQRNVIV
ncbi:MAG TPA: fumarylacetoacetate hydrolase family protein [Enteractinococcus helveticum]|uniref:Fumarylacetoacetate hydrolase family protein n=1 Tax=Enteractinococcus helveticum TaxID=1837282 RepID=A0A921K8N1_9MICC|nr:fumarylacetoacetate hydrolase family protein [Enteractinococcus helveticum]HJF15728.1 fumarylacetoacetate hydrolase family protein [Enteractinococcus helveticum]